jgi:hypothetical protein
MRWWTTRGEHDEGGRFVMRWPARYHIWDLLGEKKPAWQWTRGKRTRHWKPLFDSHGGRWHRTGVVWLPVRHPAYPGPLWLVVSRRGTGKKPWYLLTNEYVDSPEHTWDMVLAHARRWQIEMAWRFLKHELATESPRLWKWENRQKLLLMVSLVYAFLLSLLNTGAEGSARRATAPLLPPNGEAEPRCLGPAHRPRTAICYLWSAFLLDCARVTLHWVLTHVAACLCTVLVTRPVGGVQDTKAASPGR